MPRFKLKVHDGDLTHAALTLEGAAPPLIGVFASFGPGQQVDGLTVFVMAESAEAAAFRVRQALPGYRVEVEN